MDHELTISDTWEPEDEKAVEAPLVAYNRERFGDAGLKKLGIFLRDPQGNIEGGLIGHTARGWLYTKLIFIPERLRGQGLAGRLLAAAEQEAKARGCTGAFIDSMNADAVRTYERLGYVAVGKLDGFAGDSAIVWLAKRFS
ncbi:GNAT family N-acetyltransferase [Rhizobium panacihumi]|uniref:GNAT family N-acetyltransferase n=1 Tax=Rhizobium panacihumi TaxID=2008450 RepID=UPI003D79A348